MSAVTGLPLSVQTRLVRHAKLIGLDPNLVLSRYAAERFSISTFALATS